MSEQAVVTRMRHENARRRRLTIVEKQQLAPHYLALRLHGEDWEGFHSAAPDDHIKLFVPDGPLENGKPAMRDYTPRAFDAARGELVIEFALHDDPGPATAWAIAAQVGDAVEIGGPRGSTLIAPTLDWYWLLGDEAAIPAMLRRMAEWPQANIRALAAVAGAQEELPLALAPAHGVQWVHRPASAAGDPAALLAALAAWDLPAGEGFIWIAAEAGVAKALREALLARGHEPSRMKAAGYWTKGQADTTVRLD